MLPPLDCQLLAIGPIGMQHDAAEGMLYSDPLSPVILEAGQRPTKVSQSPTEFITQTWSQKVVS